MTVHSFLKRTDEGVDANGIGVTTYYVNGCRVSPRGYIIIEGEYRKLHGLAPKNAHYKRMMNVGE